MNAISRCSLGFVLRTERQSEQADWVRVDGERAKEEIANDVFASVEALLQKRVRD